MCLQRNLCDSWSLILLSLMWVFNFTTMHSPNVLPNGENLNLKSTILKVMGGGLHMSMFDCEEHLPVKPGMQIKWGVDKMGKERIYYPLNLQRFDVALSPSMDTLYSSHPFIVRT